MTAYDFAKRTPCVLLLDEIDAIAKRRSDDTDIGGLKRLVTVILQEVDELPATGLLSDGTTKKLCLSRPLPIDHAYCRTVYASQGATCERVFIEADTSSLTSNQGTFYVALSKARSEVTIFTDDADYLAPAMSRSHAKSSALDSNAQAPAIEDNL